MTRKLFQPVFDSEHNNTMANMSLHTHTHTHTIIIHIVPISVHIKWETLFVRWAASSSECP